MKTSMEQVLQEFGMSVRDAATRLGISRGRVIALVRGADAPSTLEQFAIEGFAAALRNGDIISKSTPYESDMQPTGGLAPSLEGDTWTARAARLAVSYLAQNPKPLTYGDLHNVLSDRGSKRDIGTLTKYSWPLGRVNDTMQEASRRLGTSVPPLAALVFNTTSTVPSPGINPYLMEYLNDTDRRGIAKRIIRNDSAPRDIVDLIQSEIMAFPNWEEVVRIVGLTGNPAEDL